MGENIVIFSECYNFASREALLCWYCARCHFFAVEKDHNGEIYGVTPAEYGGTSVTPVVPGTVNYVAKWAMMLRLACKFSLL